MSRQSPVNIDDTRLVTMTTGFNACSFLTLSYTSDIVKCTRQSNSTSHGNERTWLVDDHSSHAMWNGTRYTFIQMHLHTPSEHTVNGNTYDGEIHLVHQDLSADAYLVVAYFINFTGNAIPQLFDSLLTVVPSTHVSIQFPPIQNTIYTYQGSLTTAPFSANVTWIVQPISALVSGISVHVSGTGTARRVQHTVHPSQIIKMKNM